MCVLVTLLLQCVRHSKESTPCPLPLKLVYSLNLDVWQQEESMERKEEHGKGWDLLGHWLQSLPVSGNHIVLPSFRLHYNLDIALDDTKDGGLNLQICPSPV